MALSLCGRSIRNRDDDEFHIPSQNAFPEMFCFSTLREHSSGWQILHHNLDGADPV